MAYCFMNINKIKSLSQMSAAYNHNYRTSPEHFPENADPSRSYLNRELVPLSKENYNATFQERMVNLGYGIDKNIRKNAVLALEILLSFSREKMADETFHLMKRETVSIEWAKSTFNSAPEKYGDNVISAVTHYDESTPHISLLILPISPTGQLCADFYLKGGPKRMSELQTSYANDMQQFGLLRGQEHSHIKHQDIKLFYSELSKALTVNPPKWGEKDNPVTYQEKVKEMLKEQAAVSLRLKKEQESTLVHERAAHKEENTVLEKKLAAANRKIHKYEKKEEEFEREFGSIEIVKKKLESVRLMRDALDEMEPNEANKFIEQLNEMVRIQRHREKMRAEEAKKRKKNVFDRIE